MPSPTTYVSTVADNNAPVQGVQQIIGPGGSSHFEQRPTDYFGGAQPNGPVYGHYRAVSFSGACLSISAAGILASLRWTSTVPPLFLLTRLSMNIEIIAAVTAAPLFDAQAFVFRGSTGNASGTNSTTLTMTTVNQKCRASMSTSAFGVGGEIRTIATTTALTGCAGKTNDSAPFGAAFWGCLYDTSSTGVATLVSPGAAMTPGGWQDLFIANQYNHPIALVANEGIEIQVITANNTTGSVKYGFTWEWVEAAAF